MRQSDLELVQFFWLCIKNSFLLFVCTGLLFGVFHWNRHDFESWRFARLLEETANGCGRVSLFAFGMTIVTVLVTSWFCYACFRNPVLWVMAGP